MELLSGIPAWVVSGVVFPQVNLLCAIQNTFSSEWETCFPIIKKLGKGNCTFTVLSLPPQVLQTLPHPGDAFVSSWSNTQVSYVLVLPGLRWIHLTSLRQNTSSYKSSGEQTRRTLPALRLLLLGCYSTVVFNLIFLCVFTCWEGAQWQDHSHLYRTKVCAFSLLHQE